MFAYRIHVIALLLAGTLGCRFNSNYCEGRNSNDNCSEPATDGGADAAPSCTSSASCPAETPACDLTAKQCAQCLASEPTAPSACGGTEPVCAANNTCQPCTAHSQCASSSSVCLPEGACAPETQVAYVQQGKPGKPEGGCPQSDPCPFISDALTTNKRYIKITGTISEPRTVKVDKGTLITFLGDPANEPASRAKLTRASSGPIIEVVGAALAIYDLEVFGATGSPGGVGISVPLSATPSTVTLHRASIVNNEGGGVVASGGTLNITQSAIRENANGGIIMNNPMQFKIVNNIIVRNGNISSVVGGISVFPDQTGSKKLEFNTIVNNNSGAGSLAGGIICSSADVTWFPVPNNLIFDNGGGAGLQISSKCAQGSSLITNPGANFSADYHLTAATPAGEGKIRDAVACPVGIAEDYDGDERPPGASCDLGADEYIQP